MKKNDIAIIVAVAIVAGVFSFIVAKMIFGGDQKYSLTAPTVDVISAEFNTDTVYLNDKSIDLTKDNQTITTNLLIAPQAINCKKERGEP